MSNGNGSTALAVPVQRKTVMGELSERYSMDAGKLLETIKATCIKGSATNEQVQAFLIVANRYGLDPFLKEIHAFAGQGGGIVPIVGIDGWSKIANSTGKFDGCEFAFDGAGADLACTCTIYVKDRTHPVKVTEYLNECKRNTPPWNQYTRRMLRHKAFMQCVRVAFGLGGIHDEDEARDIIQNEAGGMPTVTESKLKALNEAARAASVKPHPADPALTIDPSTSNESPEPDVDGAQAEPEFPPVEDPQIFYEFMGEMAQRDKVADFDAAMNRVNLNHGTNGNGAKHRAAREAVARAALAGTLDWETGKIKG